MRDIVMIWVVDFLIFYGDSKFNSNYNFVNPNKGTNTTITTIKSKKDRNFKNVVHILRDCKICVTLSRCGWKICKKY